MTATSRPSPSSPSSSAPAPRSLPLSSSSRCSTWRGRPKTGHKPPKADDQGDAGLAEVVVAAAITGALVAMARVLATRGTARFTAKVDD